MSQNTGARMPSKGIQGKRRRKRKHMMYQSIDK